jgi:hypothetical protein
MPKSNPFPPCRCGAYSESDWATAAEVKAQQLHRATPVRTPVRNKELVKEFMMPVLRSEL